MRKTELAYKNTDKNIWRKFEGDYYSPSIHVTQNNNIGINIGGHVIVKPIEDWFHLAYEKEINKCDHCGYKHIVTSIKEIWGKLN